MPDSITPILYTVPTRPVEKPLLMIEETETDGDTVWTGPFAVGDARLERSLGSASSDASTRPACPRAASRWLRGYRRRPSAADATRPLRPASATDAVPAARAARGPGAAAGREDRGRAGPGSCRIPAADLAGYGLPEPGRGRPSG